MILEHPILAGIIIAALLVCAYLLDIFRWKKKPIGELYDMLNSPDPKKMMIGLTQLRRRKEDISSHIQRVIPFLLAESAVDRVTGKMIIQKHYPEDYALIKEYAGTDDLEKCKNTLSKLHTKYGVSS